MNEFTKESTKAFPPGLTGSLLLASLVSLPFLNRPFHIDDPNFLALARHAWPNPLKLYDFTLNWGGVPERAFDILSNPPLGPWLLALLGGIGGVDASGVLREWVYHLGFLPFLLATLVGIHRLSERFAPDWMAQGPFPARFVQSLPFLALAAPALLVSSHSVMPDVPLLACLTLGLAMSIRGLDEGSRRGSFVGGMVLGLAALFRYSGVLGLPLLLVYGLLRPRRRERTQPWPLLLALLGASLPSAGWAALSLWQYGQIHLLAMVAFQASAGRAVADAPESLGLSLQLFPLMHKALYQVSSLGLAIALPAVLVWGLGGARGRGARVGALVGALAWGLAVGFAAMGPSAGQNEGISDESPGVMQALLPLFQGLPWSSSLLLLVGWVGAGVVLGQVSGSLWHWLQALARLKQALTGSARWSITLERTFRTLLRPEPRAADTLFLSLWVLGVLLFNERLLFASVRYLLPLLPPVLLLLARAGEPRVGQAQMGQAQTGQAELTSPDMLARLPRRLQGAIGVGLLAPALALGLADQNQARAYRDGALSLSANPANTSSATWFVGHWGFQHYLEAQGAHAVDEVTGGPRSGDRLLVPIYPWPQDVPESIQGKPREFKRFSAPWGLRPCTLAGRGSFYSFMLAPNATPVVLPFALASDPLEVITVWQVE